MQVFGNADSYFSRLLKYDLYLLYQVNQENLCKVPEISILENSCNTAATYHLLLRKTTSECLVKKIMKKKLFLKQGGSLMCVGTWCSTRAHLHFWLNCHSNEEISKKKVCVQKSLHTPNWITLRHASLQRSQDLPLKKCQKKNKQRN